MPPASTLTLLGQAQTNESATKMNGSVVVTKSQLDLPIDGLRIRDSANVVRGKGGDQVITDENNNVSKAGDNVEPPQPATAGEPTKGAYRMWGFYPVDQPVKTLNSILIPIVHLVCLFALANITLNTSWSTIAWGESLKIPIYSVLRHVCIKFVAFQ